MLSGAAGGQSVQASEDPIVPWQGARWMFWAACAALALAVVPKPQWLYAVAGDVHDVYIKEVIGRACDLVLCAAFICVIAWRHPERLSVFGIGIRRWHSQVASGVCWGAIAVAATGATRWGLANGLIACGWSDAYSLRMAADPYLASFRADESYFGTLIIVFALGAITEETMMRGVIQSCATMVFRSRAYGIAVASAIFVALHFPYHPVVVANLVALSACYGIARSRANGILSAIVAHASYNVATSVIALR